MPTLLACGSNGAGQLALGHTEDVSTFTPCKFDPSCPADGEIVDLVSTASHALLLYRHGSELTLLGAGTNTHGQLGLQCALSKEQPKTSFRRISLARDAGLETWKPVLIAATWTTSFVVLANGEQEVIVAAGSNDFGELGTGEAGKPGLLKVDVGLREGETIKSIRGGQRHVIVVIGKRGGGGQRIVGWGASRRGELDPARPQLSSTKGKGKAPALPAIRPPTEIKLNSSQPIVNIALGAAHTVVHHENGSVSSWGSDAKGQITGLDGYSTPGMDRIAATWGGSYLLGKGIWSQGSNTHCQLLRAADTPARKAVAFPGEGEPDNIVAGSEHVLVTADRHGHTELWTGGWNEHGNLGLGDTVDRAELVQVTSLEGSVRRVWGGCAASWALVDSA